jgi:osmotically-inducible protein OsmY
MVMVQSAALLLPPTREPTREEMVPAGATLSHLTQSAVDLDLVARVERALCATGHGSLRGVHVSVSAGVVSLTGQVPSYYLKQVAQTAALAVPGEHQVRNELTVNRPS